MPDPSGVRVPASPHGVNQITWFFMARNPLRQIYGPRHVNSIRNHAPRAQILASILAGLALLSSSCGTQLDAAMIEARTNQLYGDPPPIFPDLPNPVGQAPVLGEGADLEAYIVYGLYYNPAIRASFERWRAAAARVGEVSDLPDPRFSWGYFVEPIETRTGPQNNRFTLSQTFPWFGKLDELGEVAAREAEAMWWKVEAQRLQVVREIKQAYFKYAFLARHIRITEDTLLLLTSLEPVTQRRLQAGASQGELLQLQVEIGQLENTLKSLERFQPALSASLSAAINRRFQEPLPWPDLQEPDFVEVDHEALERLVASDNPELRELQELIRREESRQRLADLEGWPDFTVGVDYFETGEALMPGTPGSGDDPWALTLSLNLPIFRGKYDAMAEQARHSNSAAQAELREKDNALYAQLQMVLYELEDAERQVELYSQSLLPRAQQSLRVTETAYRGGTATLLDLIDRQRMLLAFEQTYWRSCADYEQSLADLEALRGGELR